MAQDEQFPPILAPLILSHIPILVPYVNAIRLVIMHPDYSYILTTLSQAMFPSLKFLDFCCSSDITGSSSLLVLRRALATPGMRFLRNLTITLYGPVLEVDTVQFPLLTAMCLHVIDNRIM